MEITNVANFRNNFKSFMDKVVDSDEPVHIVGPNNKNVVVLSKDSFDELQKLNLSVEKVIMNNSSEIITDGISKPLVLTTLEEFNHLKQINIMETLNSINWKDDFRYNESLHSTAQGLGAAYSRLLRNHPEHADANLWKEEKAKWPKYNSEIKDMVINTEKEAIDETNRIAEIYKKVLETEKYLDNKVKTVSLKH